MLGDNDFKNDADEFFFKRPKLMLHRFKLERQSILLLSTRGFSSSAILSEQEMKINKFSSFIDSLEAQLKDIMCESLEEGLEMLLRAVKIIKSHSKQNLLLKLQKFKLKIILGNGVIDSSRLKDCLNDCISNSQNKSIDSFEQYYGMHPQLDDLIGVKILEFSFNLGLKEKIQLCSELARRGGRENILKDLLVNVFHELKSESCLDCDSMLTLLGMTSNFDIGEYTNQCMLIFQSNREVFLDNSRIFNKFLDSSSCPIIRRSPQFSSLITSFNSRIRSFLNRPEAKRDGIFFSCVKFVLEYYDLGIGCIGQFAEFLLKFPLIKIEDCCSLTRKFVYKLLVIQLKKSETTLKDSKFTEMLKLTDLRCEFIQEMLERNCSDPLLLKLYTDYLDDKYTNILENYLKLFPFTASIYSQNDEEDFFIDLEDIDSADIDTPQVIEEGALLFFKESLLPVFTKYFKSSIDCFKDEMFLKNLAVITGLLLGGGKVSWTDLSGAFGPNAANSCTRWEGRAAHCKIYTSWLRLPVISGTTRNTLRTVLNPDNYAELWLKSLFDLQPGEQVTDLFNEYYGLLLSDRIDCLKMIKAPVKYKFDMLCKCVDFKSSLGDWWKYLLQIGDQLSNNNVEISKLIFDIYCKHLPATNLEFIWRLYEIGIKTVEDINRTPRRDHIVRFALEFTVDSECNTILVLKRLRHFKGPLIFLMGIFYEFLSSDQKNKSIFIIQTFLSSICVDLVPGNYLLELTEELREKCAGLCKKGDWLQVYRLLVILTQLKIVPNELKFVLQFLCQLNKIDVLEIDSHECFTITETVSDSSVDISCDITKLYFKESILVLSKDQPSPFNCLTQLLKLLQLVNNNSKLDLFLGYVKKQIGSKDEYFNIIFPE